MENNESLILDGQNIHINPEGETASLVPSLTEVPETLVEVVEDKTHIYQPTDEQGRPIGGKQVIKYKTNEELVNKLQEQNVLILRKLRSETRKNRLGILDDSEAPSEGQKYSAPIEFKPLKLTPDESLALSRDLLDPERQEEAKATLWKSVTGVDPEQFNSTLNRIQAENIKLQAKIEADAFVANNKDYVICNENFEAITNWMMRYDLAPVRDNFQKAFNALKTADVLILPEEAERVITQTQPELVSQIEIPITVEPKPEQKPEFSPARIPSGLTRESSADAIPVAGKIGEDLVYQFVRDGKVITTYTGIDALRAMPADEYKRRVLYEKGFKEKEALIEASLSRK